MSRSQALTNALARYDDDGDEGYYARLAKLVAVKTESQNPDRLNAHYAYVKDHMTPALERLGYECRVYDNPFEECGPVFSPSVSRMRACPRSCVTATVTLFWAWKASGKKTVIPGRLHLTATGFTGAVLRTTRVSISLI